MTDDEHPPMTQEIVICPNSGAIFSEWSEELVMALVERHDWSLDDHDSEGPTIHTMDDVMDEPIYMVDRGREGDTDPRSVRTDPALIEEIRRLGDDATKKNGELVIVEVPDDVDWHIRSSEAGGEWVAEDHRRWSDGERY